ncbi:MAG: sugar phosphate isomerase/epimerase, partial [Methylobacterium sp.]|nr:sugar phosphate isomerase/epimerase [Methylobacterium sp.]
MIPSIATVCISGNLLEKLEAIAKAGFRAVEIFENDLIAHPGSPAEVRLICEDLGLKIVTCQPFRDFEGMPAPRRCRRRHPCNPSSSSNSPWTRPQEGNSRRFSARWVSRKQASTAR